MKTVLRAAVGLLSMAGGIALMDLMLAEAIKPHPSYFRIIICMAIGCAAGACGMVVLVSNLNDWAKRK